MIHVVIYIGEDRHFVAEEKLIHPESNLQKCEPLKSRFRVNLEKRLLDGHLLCI